MLTLVLSQVADPATDPFLQYGLVGAVCLVLLASVRYLAGLLKETLDRETRRADENKKALLEQSQMMLTELTPAMIRMVDTTKDLVDLVAEERRRRELDQERRRALD